VLPVFHLLDREREPAFYFRIEVGLKLKVDRDVMHGARSRNLHAILAELRDSRLKPVDQS
jgi:hypothetical protein